MLFYFLFSMLIHKLW